MSTSNSSEATVGGQGTTDQSDLVNQALLLEFAQFQAGFLARASHELRSPLSSLMSCQQLILNDLCDNPEEERLCVQQAYAAAQRLLKMLDTLVQVSKLKIGRIPTQIQTVPLKHLLDEAYSLTNLAIANRNAHLEIECFLPEDSAVLGDAFVLRQIFPLAINLVLPELTAGCVTLQVVELPDTSEVQFALKADQAFEKLQATVQDLHVKRLDDFEQNQKVKTHLLDLQTNLDAPHFFSSEMQLLILQTLLGYIQGRVQLQQLLSEGFLYFVLKQAS